MKLPCPRCGKKDVIGTFCVSCLRELSPIIEKIKESKITFCVESGQVKLQNAWEDLTQREALQKVIERALIPRAGAVIEEMSVESGIEDELLRKPGINRELLIRARVKGKADADIPEAYEEEYDVPVHLLTTINPRFAKVGTDYFEGVFQARNETPKRKKAFLDAVAERARNGMAINDEKPVKLGREKKRFVKQGEEELYAATDYQVTRKQILRAIAHDMHEKFGGVMKENARLITHDKQKSKDVHRLTIMIDYPPYDWNDVLVDEHESRLLVVKNLGKKIRYLDVLRGKNVEEPYEPGKYSIIETQTLKVCQTHPELAVIDPKSFQQIRLFHTGTPELGVGDEARVAKLKNRWWLIP